MARSRLFRGAFSPPVFSLILGFLIYVVFFGLSLLDVFDRPERLISDAHFGIKTFFSSTSNRGIQEGVINDSKSAKISRDIVIVGIEEQTLATFGRWPFPRDTHAGLLQTMSRISDPNNRESAVLLDFLFFDVGDRAYEDVILLDAMSENGNVVLQTQLYNVPIHQGEDMGNHRLATLISTAGEITDVRGDTSAMKRWYGIEAPLPPYSRTVKSYGYATYVPDSDDIFRRLQLISIYSEKVAEYRIQDLKIDTKIPVGEHGHLAFVDRNGLNRIFPLPLDRETLEEVRNSIADRGVERVEVDTGERNLYVSAYTDHFMPATALSLALEYFNRNLEDLTVVPGSHITIPDPRKWDAASGEWTDYRVPTGALGRGGSQVLNEIRIPIDESGAMVINYMGGRSSSDREGRQTYPVRSYAAVARQAPSGEDWPATKGWAGKVLMVGAFTKAMADDEKTTPLGLMFGVEMQANALNTIVMNNFITEAPVWINAVLMFVLVALVSLLSSRMQNLGGATVIVLALVLVSFSGVSLAFGLANLHVPWFAPAAASLAAFLVIVIYRVLSAERDRRQIKNVFGQFISPSIVEELSESKAMPELGGENRDVSIFFSDIRDFSGLSERKNDPQELVSLLNEYLTEMTDNIVINFDGTLDKYIGDAIMAIWGAPKDMTRTEHAVNACKSALMQIDLLGKLNERLAEAALESEDGVGDNLQIGIGIHSGECMVGYMGSEGRKNYTAMGDTVNLASRLEGVNKTYATRILISDETRARIIDEPFIVRELDQIRVKGRYTPVTIYELVDYEGELYTAPEKSARGRRKD